MDPHTERELVDNIKLMSNTLVGIKEELSDLNSALREAIEAQALHEEESGDDEEEEDEEEESDENSEEDDDEVEDDKDDKDDKDSTEEEEDAGASF